MIRLETPAIEATHGGLLAVVAPETIDSSIIRYVDTYERPLDVLPQLIPETGDKSFAKSENGTAQAFTVYTGYEGSLLFQNGQDYTSQLEESHKNGSSHAVESALQTLILNPQATDLTPVPATAVTNGRLAAGLLEQWIAENTRTRPVIHTNRLGAALLRDLKVEADWILHTKQGTPVANGSGYSATGPTVATAGQAWVYITGQVSIWKSEMETVEAPEPFSNRKYILVETDYLISIEGPVGALLLGSA